MSSAPHVAVKATRSIPQEKARHARARVWAYVFECARTRATQTAAQDDPKMRKRKEADHVDLSRNQTSDIQHHQFKKEK